MRTSLAVIVVVFCFFASAGRVVATVQRCTLPSGLDVEVSKQFPGMHVVRVADLSDYDRKLYRKDHGERCPGLVKVDFYGDRKPTWAVVVTSGQSPRRTSQLLVAHQGENGWELRCLEESDGAPVVWRQGPGKYEGMYSEEKPIRAKHPVVVLFWYGSSAILYAWTGSEVRKVWLSD